MSSPARQAPSVSFPLYADDEAHYRASIALEEVIGWFLDDGYTAENLSEFCAEKIADLAESRADDV